MTGLNLLVNRIKVSWVHIKEVGVILVPDTKQPLSFCTSSNNCCLYSTMKFKCVWVLLLPLLRDLLRSLCTSELVKVKLWKSFMSFRHFNQGWPSLNEWWSRFFLNFSTQNSRSKFSKTRYCVRSTITTNLLKKRKNSFYRMYQKIPRVVRK